MSGWQGWGAAGVGGRQHLGALRWDKCPRSRGGVVERMAPAAPGEWVSSAGKGCAYTHISIHLYITYCTPRRQQRLLHPFSELLLARNDVSASQAGCTAIGGEQGCGCQLEALQSFMGTSVCVSWARLDTNRWQKIWQSQVST